MTEKVVTINKNCRLTLQRGFQIEISYQPMEIVGMEAQKLRSLCVIAAGLAESVLDQLPFRVSDPAVKLGSFNRSRGILLEKSLRQIFENNHFCRSHHNGPFNGVLEFAHIARPVIAHQKLADFWRYRRDGFSGFFRALGGKVAGQQRNVLATFA